MCHTSSQMYYKTKLIFHQLHAIQNHTALVEAKEYMPGRIKPNSCNDLLEGFLFTHTMSKYMSSYSDQLLKKKHLHTFL